ncbi:SLC13 family permease [Actinomadura yumaensis]|uniref:SLC13 family permease n=1 Tax=Actinomadura yumaensis TaxID=111807 RepID=UPI00360CCF91
MSPPKSPSPCLRPRPRTGPCPPPRPRPCPSPVPPPRPSPCAGCFASWGSGGGGSGGSGAGPVTAYQVGSLAGLGVFVVAVLAFGMNVAFVALAVGLVLHAAFRPDTRRVVADLPWGVVVLTAGILVYVADLERVGTLKTLARHLGGIDGTLLTVLAIAYLAAFFATIESSTVAVLGLIVPLAATALPHQTSAQFTALLVAVCGTIGAVAISPLHLGGGLVLANTREEDTPRVFRWTLGWSVGAAVLLPAVLLLVPLAAGI